MAAAQKKPDISAKYYTVLVDAILGAHQPEDAEAQPHQWRVLKGNVTGADLIAAGVDIGWQLRIGALEELGYAPSN
jgi:hypothetical protein